MSESTADAALRWREQELRAAWEMGRDAVVKWLREGAAIRRAMPDEGGTNQPHMAGEWDEIADAVGYLSCCATIGDLVKEKAHGR